MGTSAMLYY